MRAVLTTSIPVERVAAFAEMAWMERRPELALICRAAQSANGRIASATVQSVLSGLGEAGAQNVVKWCVMLGLCDRQGGLTRVGEDVADSGHAPVPEQGAYDLWLAEHPVIGSRILSVERLSSRPDQRFEWIEAPRIAPDPGVIFRSVADPQQRFLFRGFPTNHGQAGCLPGETEATCRLRWTIDFDGSTDQWQLDGTIEAGQGMRPMQHKPERDGIDPWGLAETWALGPLAHFGRWQAKERRLAVSLASLTEAEQDSFKKTLRLEQVEVPGKGVYKDVTLEDVPISPASAGEAQRWAMSRLDRHLARETAYRSRGEVRRVFADLAEGTALEAFHPELPAHEKLVTNAFTAKKLDVFWSLAAPVDLAPRSVPQEDLDALSIGKPAPVVTPAAVDSLRVPHRSPWPMRQFVDRMMSGAVPRRVLLCDRFVRGADNLATLRVLVQAVREVGASAQFHVWTGDEEADFKLIQAITGTPPRSYRDVFARNMPHDRFVLVVPVTGEAFAWHLSNSPLHARADIPNAGPLAPLRWKDLVGVRESADALPPPLRQWLTGGP